MYRGDEKIDHTARENFLLQQVVLRSFVSQCDLITFLDTVPGREPLLHVFDGFSDRYLSRRITGQPHETAMVGLSDLKISEPREDGNLDWVALTPPLGEYITSCGDRARACYITAPRLFILTYAEVSWSSFKATIPSRLISLV